MNGKLTTRVECPRCHEEVDLDVTIYLEKPNNAGKALATLRLTKGFEVHECNVSETPETTYEL